MALRDDLILEAATAYMTQLARRVHNDMVRENGDESPHSDEVVNVKGRDLLLGDTDEIDRNWLAQNRETLADGLRRRAASIRQFGAAGYALDHSEVTTREVLSMEREAERLERLAGILRAVGEKNEQGKTVLETMMAESLEQVESQISEAEAREAQMMSFMERLTGEDIVVFGTSFRRTRRAIKRVVDLFIERQGQ